MREFLRIAAEQLWRLTVITPAWLLTPDGRKALFSAATARRLLVAVGFALALVALLQTFPADVALILAGDVMTYAEVAAIVWIAGAHGILTQGLAACRRVGRPALRRLRIGGRRPRAIRRRLRPPPVADDDGPAAPGWLLAA